jgi:hypothetical protein
MLSREHVMMMNYIKVSKDTHTSTYYQDTDY